MQHEMPKPTADHMKLAAMAGSWTSVETLHPNAWTPAGAKRTGRCEARVAVDGFFVLSDYEQSDGDRVAYRGHGVFGYDVAKQRWSMHWFDSMGGVPAHLVWGNWEADTLTYETSGPQGWSRYVYRFEKDGVYVFSILTSKDGNLWTALMDGRFTRK